MSNWGGKEEINEMEYNGTSRGMNSNPTGLYVYRKRQHHGNTTPAGVGQTIVVMHFYKHLMPPASLLPLLSLTSVSGKGASLLPLTSVNGKETAPRITGLQPHSMWLKPFAFMKSANRQLKQTACPDFSGAIKQTACPDFSGAIKQTACPGFSGAKNKFKTRLNILNLSYKYSILTT